MIARTMNESDRRAVAIWLLVSATLVFAMVVVGGITRLTHSGLSIVEWQPLVGTVPPMTDEQWQELFLKYQETPEFQQVNFDIDLEGFKRIFWWEYSHRLLGRVIGIVYLLPYLWFLLRGRLDSTRARQLAGVFVLGGLQGALGWYMVMSGLVDDPKVSPLRLTAHLGLALAILSAELWIAFELLAPARPLASGPTARWPAAIAAIVYLQALTGGMVAGVRAGRAYNTFPLMSGHWVPPEIMMLDPWWQNFLYNMATVQFVHRGIAWLLTALILVLWLRSMAAGVAPRTKLASHLLLAALALQVSLGIGTLLMAVPVPLAAAHQAGAVLLLAAALWAAHEPRRGLPLYLR